mgnify:CR=1 FL=1
MATRVTARIDLKTTAKIQTTMTKILLIDDDANLRTITTMALESAGHQIIEARDGKEGYRLFREHRPDLVITDLVMPEQEGIETIAQLRREQPSLPIIAISGGLARSALYLTIAAQIGAQHTLAKPFAIAELLGAIDTALGRTGGAKPV